MANPFIPRILEEDKKSGKEERLATRSALGFYALWVLIGFVFSGAAILIMRLFL